MAKPAVELLMGHGMRLRDLGERAAACKFYTYFPPEGPFRRSRYPRSMMFFALGGVKHPDGTHKYRERLFLAANRTSKTVSAAYEITCHLTGDYPKWWTGRRFEGPIEAWAAGDSRETTRDIVQQELFGPQRVIKTEQYCGMLPPHRVAGRTLKTGVADCVDVALIEHVEKVHGAPGISTLGFKSYDQGRDSFQGTSKHVIWLDEEPPDATEKPSSDGGTASGNGDIYTECLLRTSTTDGVLISTFTPLRGLTPFVDHYLATADMIDSHGAIVNAKVAMFGSAQ